MLKNFFRHWHYGVTAKVVDGALVAYVDTAVEPVFLRFDLARLQSVLIDVVNKGGDHELMLVGIGAPAASTTLARFDTKDAALEAAACLRGALLRGNRKSRFRSAFKTTLGIIAAIAFVTMLAGLTGEALVGNTARDATPESVLRSLTESTNQAIDDAVKAESAPALADPGEPQAADAFLQDR